MTDRFTRVTLLVPGVPASAAKAIENSTPGSRDGGGGTLQSCGMHAFSLPDVRIQIDDDPGALQALATALDVYQLAEDPVIRTGQTFAPDASTPRRVVERWPDMDYPRDHACHNPYGVWRLGPPGGEGRALGEIVPVFMPSLSVVLAATEQKKGAPLDEHEVVAIHDGGVCMAMSPQHAQALERKRGYADLEPELVWPQWKLLRTQTHSRT